MNLNCSARKSEPNIEITPLIDVVFLLLVFMLLTMTFSQKNDAETKEAIIDIQLAKSSTTSTPNPPETLTLLVDEHSSIYRSDEPMAKTREELKFYLSEKLLSSPDLHVNVKADHRTPHGQVIDALDILKELGIEQVNLVIEKKAN